MKYLNALYFSIVTMCTVGYGDVYPTNHHEIILLIVNMLIACGVFAHAVRFSLFYIFIYLNGMGGRSNPFTFSSALIDLTNLTCSDLKLKKKKKN